MKTNDYAHQVLAWALSDVRRDLSALEKKIAAAAVCLEDAKGDRDIARKAERDLEEALAATAEPESTALH